MFQRHERPVRAAAIRGLGALAGAAPLLCLAPVFAGCVTSQSHERALEEKDATIRALREEKVQLKQEILSLRASRDQAPPGTADAPARVAEAATPARRERAADDLGARSAPAALSELEAEGIGTSVRDGHVVVTIPSSITFAAGQAKLSTAGQKALRKVAAKLRSEFPGARFSIEGHTDADPISKSAFASNRDLSLARAMAVLRFLVEDCQIADDHCIVAGHGQYQPVAPNQKEADKARNRRVEIVVLH